MSNEFMREERYIVFKISDIVEHLTTTEALHLARLYEIQRVGRREAGKAELECVVVESDWPEYEPTWKAIEARVTGARAQPASSVPDGWLRAIDEALVTAHIGVANAHDTYEQAKAKLNNLICFNVDIATDQAVNGGWKLVPVEPTQEMINLVIDERFEALVAGKDHTFIDIYKAMLAAAPEAKP